MPTRPKRYEKRLRIVEPSSCLRGREYWEFLPPGCVKGSTEKDERFKAKKEELGKALKDFPISSTIAYIRKGDSRGLDIVVPILCNDCKREKCKHSPCFLVKADPISIR